MNERIAGILWKGLSIVLYVASAATAFAVLYALTARTTLAAVESAFGTFVILIMLLVFARKCWQKGRADMHAADIPQSPGPDKSL